MIKQDTITIPQQLIDAGARFILVAPKEKRAIEKDWPVNNYDSQSPRLIEHLAAGGNYGVLTLNGICCLDVDDPKKLKELGITMSPSFSVQRGGGKSAHYYFRCPDCPVDMRTKHECSWGDIRLGGNFYTVGPNCIAPTRDNPPVLLPYEIYCDVPINDAPWALIEGILRASGTDTSEITLIDEKKPFKIPAVTKQRHPVITASIGVMVRAGFTYNAIENAIIEENKHFEVPKQIDVLKREILSAYQYCTKNHVMEEARNERETITEAQIQEYRDEHINSFSELPKLPEGFFEDYMDFGIRMSYAYSAFHLGNALALASLVAGRKVSMKSTGATIFPNVFVCCVGPTSTSGKSTACDLMFDQFFGLIRKEQAIEELTKKMSPAGLLERLSAIPTRLWYYDECSEFFSDIANRWAESLESILCSVYDGRAVSYGLSKGKGKIDEYRASNVFLTCVWNTTDSEMERRAQWSHVTNGFLPRFMWFWCHAKNTPRANREITKEDLAAREALYKQIQRVRVALDRPKGESMIVFKPHTDIEKWKLNDDLKHLDKDQEMHRIATARLMPQAYKIATLFSLFDADILTIIESTVAFPKFVDIPDKHAELAIDICEHYLRPRLEYLMDLSKNNDTKNLQIQVIRCLKNHNGIAKKSLVQRETHINKRNFEETIQSLEDAEAIEVFGGDATGGRKGEVLKLLKNI